MDSQADFGSSSLTFYTLCRSPLLATKPAANVPEGTPTGPDDPDLKGLLIQMIRDRVANKGDYAKTAAILEAGEIVRLSAAPTLGEAFLAGGEGTEALDRLARYEAFIVNQLQKAMQGLEDLQAKRLAQAD